MKYGLISISFLCVGRLFSAELENAKDEQPKTLIRQASNTEAIKRFERSPTGWKAGFRSVKDWKGQRGFSPESQATDKTGVGWFSVDEKSGYRNIRAPRRANYAVFEGQHDADHTQLHGVGMRKPVKAGEIVEEIEGAFDMTVAFQDDGTPRVKPVLNAFFQIFECTKEMGWKPTYAHFFENEKLLIGAWNDKTAVPSLTLRRGQWYRIRFDVRLQDNGAITVLSVWPVDQDGKQGSALVSGLIIEHPQGLKSQGLARSFPVAVGSYTWCVKGKEPYSAATLMCAYSQDEDINMKVLESGQGTYRDKRTNRTSALSPFPTNVRVH